MLHDFVVVVDDIDKIFSKVMISSKKFEFEN
jgi:hypothetical protein